jgi:hypothetical protein
MLHINSSSNSMPKFAISAIAGCLGELCIRSTLQQPSHRPVQEYDMGSQRTYLCIMEQSRTSRRKVQSNRSQMFLFERDFLMVHAKYTCEKFLSHPDRNR